MNRMKPTFILCSFTVLVVAAAVSFWQSRAYSTSLATEQEDANTCRELAAEISALRELPQFAVLEAESVETIFGHIEQAADSASLGSALVRIQPSTPSYVGDSAYRIRPIRMELQAVTMEQIVRFAHQLVDENRGMTVRDLEFWQVRGDRQSAPEESWNAELTLTQLIFSPMRRQSG